MKNHPWKQRLSWTALLSLASLVFVGDAAAIIGRPLTPMSVAGVARRSVRRTAVVGAAVVATQPAYMYPYAPPPQYYAPPPPQPVYVYPQQPAPPPPQQQQQQQQQPRS
jgi:hypothetical protein